MKSHRTLFYLGINILIITLTETLSRVVGYFFFPEMTYPYIAGFQIVHHILLIFSLLFFVFAFAKKEKLCYLFAVLWVFMWILAEATTFIPADYVPKNRENAAISTPNW